MINIIFWFRVDPIKSSLVEVGMNQESVSDQILEIMKYFCIEFERLLINFLILLPNFV